MRIPQALLIVAVAFGLSGCFLRKPKANTPPAPTAKPAPAPAPAPPPEPLSVPQTNVHLPPPQPLTPEAIATTQLPGEPPPPPMPTPRPPVRQPRPAPPKPVETTPAPAAATPPAAEPERAPFTEVLPAAELKRLQEEAATRSQEARKLVNAIPRNRRRGQEQTIRRVEAFLKQVEEAEQRRDMRQASELAGRALVLAKELK